MRRRRTQGSFEGLDKELEATPRKRAWQEHVVFSDDEEDAMDPFGYARNAAQRIVTSTPLRSDDGEAGESPPLSSTALQISPQRNMAKAKRRGVSGQPPLSSTANEWGQTLSNWSVSAISNSSSLAHHSRQQTSLSQNGTHSSVTDANGRLSDQKPLHSTAKSCGHTLSNWDISAISIDSKSHNPRQQTSTTHQSLAPSTSVLSSGSARKDFECRICHRPFLSKRYATAHATTHMNMEELKKADGVHFKCKTCNKIFFNDGAYAMHLKWSHQPKTCKDCGKAFAHRSSLTRHIFTHLTPEEKAMERKKWKHLCYFCEKRFQKLSHLEMHLRTHTTEKPFACDECKSSFAQNSDLTTHSRTHSKEKSLPCEVCGKRFTQSWNLKKHKQIVHDGQRPFPCPQCARAFSTKHIMVQHLNVIHLKKKDKCPKCDSNFSTKGDMMRHLNSVHLGIRHTCKTCQKSFSLATNLQRHLKDKH